MRLNKVFQFMNLLETIHKKFVKIKPNKNKKKTRRLPDAIICKRNFGNILRKLNILLLKHFLATYLNLIINRHVIDKTFSLHQTYFCQYFRKVFVKTKSFFLRLVLFKNAFTESPMFHGIIHFHVICHR